VLLILGLLACVCAAFALEAGMNLRASKNHTDGEAARLIARAGIERAKFELRRSVTVPGYPVPWLTPDTWDYVKHAPATLTTPSDLTITTTPSLGESVTVPAVVPIAGTPGATPKGRVAPPLVPWPSGFLGSTYFHQSSAAAPFGGDYYTLQIIDESGRIDVNDAANPNLGAMLDTLASTVASVSGFHFSSGIGSAIVKNRPPLGYRSLDEVGAVLLAAHAFPPTGAAEIAALAPYLTVYGRPNPSTVTGHGTSGGTVHADLTAQPRVPINVNSAPLYVLVAALNGISGKTPDGTTYTLSSAQAKTLAQAMVTYRASPTLGGGATAGTPAVRRYGFASWSEVAAFLLSTASGLRKSPELAALVLANANPNTDLNKLAPDASIYQCIDKVDLTTSTTELCLRSQGVFDVESLGTILGSDGIVVAQAQCRAVVNAWHEHTLTTQSDFELDRVYGLGPSGTDIASQIPIPMGRPNTSLNSVTSFPEYQNECSLARGNDEFGQPGLDVACLREALWDGQITPNAIWRPGYSPVQGNPNQPAVKSNEVDGSFDGKALGNTSYKTLTGTGGWFQQAGTGPPLQLPIPNSPPIPVPLVQVIPTYDASATGGGARVQNFGATSPPPPPPPTDPQVARWLMTPGSPYVASDVIAPTAPATDPAANPDFTNGNDLEALGTLVGRGAAPARKVMWLQKDTLSTSSSLTYQAFAAEVSSNTETHNTESFSTIPPNTVIKRDTTIVNSTAASVSVGAFDLYALEAETFSFWFKPGQRIPATGAFWDGAAWIGPSGAKVVLFDWRGGAPQQIGGLAALAQTMASGAVSTITTSTVDSKGNVTSTSTPVTVTDITTNWGTSVSQGAGGSISWGANAWLVIYLVQVPTGFQLRAEFDMPLKVDPASEAVPSNMNHGYSRAWTGPTIQPGTWHHAQFSFWDPGSSTTTSPLLKITSPPSVAASSNTHTAFFADGNALASVQPEQAWPTEDDPGARLKQAIMEAGGAKSIPLASKSPQIPVLIPPGLRPPAPLIPELGAYAGFAPGKDGICLWFGGVSPSDTVASSDTTRDGAVSSFQDFFGLLYEIEVVGNSAENYVTGGSVAANKQPILLSLYNEWQPNIPQTTIPLATPPSTVATPTYYIRHLAEFEVEHEVMVFGVSATAWSAPSKGAGVDLWPGGAELLFGQNGAPQWSASASATNTAPGPNPWLGPLNATAFPNRSGVTTGLGTGFLTLSAEGFQRGEDFFFGLQLPATPATPQGQPPMPALVDDVTIFYAPWDSPKVLLEEDVP
jgi:hypothetical protein